MKKIILLLVLVGCTQKYSSYDLIRKVDFNKETYDRPTTVYEVIPNGRDNLKQCFNQWLFFSNAQSEKEMAVPHMVRSLCPKKDYLLNSDMVESWWTTILFTRACVSIETMCAELKK